jgi:hypothetical protein
LAGGWIGFIRSADVLEAASLEISVVAEVEAIEAECPVVVLLGGGAFVDLRTSVAGFGRLSGAADFSDGCRRLNGSLIGKGQ